jgi:ABC-type transport system involved in multi-copper enzyme maturation permease subunit
MKVTRHKAFSPARIAALASNTLLELVRLKVFYFMLLFALLGIGSALFAATLKFQEQLQVVKDVGLGSMSVFTWLLATLATAMLLPKDIEDRTLYTILAKPVPRLEYLLGKLLGVLLMLAIAVAMMTAFFCLVLYVRERVALAETMAITSPAELDAALQEVRRSTFNINLVPGIAIIYVKAAVVAAMTLLLSTFASSWIFTIIMSMMMYVIGHLQPIAREYWLGVVPAGTAVSPVVKLFFGLIAIAFPDFQLLNVVDDIVGNAVTLGMFLKTVGLGGGYVLVYTLVGYFLFASREL